MPSASNNKLTNDVQDVLTQINKTVEKKIRNLEKRKAKLDSYRQDANSTTLNQDQKEAIAKYDKVEGQLELAKEFMKQFNTIATDVSAQQRRVLKNQQMERSQQEKARLKQILVVQDVLNNMGGEARADFLEGANGAVKLTEENLNSLDDLYKLLSPSREEAAEKFDELISGAPDHYIALIDGKDKKVLGTTYKELKKLIDQIQHSGYFGGTQEEKVEEAELVADEEFEDARETLESRNSNSVEEAVQEETTSSPVEPKEPGENICFLQDSQIQESPDAASLPSIPTLTYTNQSFPSTTSPPETDQTTNIGQWGEEEEVKKTEPTTTTTTTKIGKWGDEDSDEVASATFTNSQGFRKMGRGRGGRGMMNGYSKPRQSHQNGGRGYGSRDGGGFRGRGGAARGSNRGRPPRGGRDRGGYQARQ